MNKPRNFASVLLTATIGLALLSSCGIGNGSGKSAGQEFYQSAEQMRSEQRFREAELLYQEALKLHETTDPSEAAKDLIGLSILYIQQQRYADAQQNLERAVLMLRRGGETGSERFVDVLWQLGLVDETLSRYKEEAAMLKAAAAAWDKLPNKNPREFSRLLRDLSRAQLLDKDAAQAEQTCQRALDFAQSSVGQESEDYALDLRQMGKAYAAEKKPDQAGESFEKAVKIFTALRGPKHAALYGTYVDWRDALASAGFAKQSEEIEKKIGRPGAEVSLEGIDPADVSRFHAVPLVVR